ncbi:MAG: hypothetical protein RIT27_854 [Pseudomonadota bacterium]|jgi:hypothetical protein
MLQNMLNSTVKKAADNLQNKAIMANNLQLLQSVILIIRFADTFIRKCCVELLARNKKPLIMNKLF